ncbi:restriction endonuclease [Epidermidibacterium keratini]|uniref:Restriction endonuclease n=1 Tax=Epidermidibacterium keratini TaxID=1891644 RepID=A0A7L4YRP4_9ACTN|nr:Eco57I restriction-modification methylase domain-containing protein [Epidermidibacterium keratini]QHC01816.1 restriction endonuclease [Epidermidibacterium keratini]
MSKKFDVVIGNPPYQEESSGTATYAMPMYHLFVDAAYEVGKKAVLITPARFLFNVGYTPKAWNAKMLADKHLTVPHYVANSDELFPGTDIKGGVAVTYRDQDFDGEPIGTFTKYPDLNSILHKVGGVHGESIAPEITSSRSYRYTDKMHRDHPEAAPLMSGGELFKINTRTFQQLDFLYSADRPHDEQDYVQVYGLAGRDRAYRWIRSDYVAGPTNFGMYKVALPKANGSGKLGEAISSPLVVGPNVALTETFITIGAFADDATAEACLRYVKSKFARVMLGVAKVTQDATRHTWKYVPMQDFTSDSDIDWSKSIAEIDQQLYAKYELDDDEIAFIETHVKPMD